MVENEREFQAGLSGRGLDGNVPDMLRLGRLLQLAALVILPLSMMAQLSGSISLGVMLRFLFVGIVIFTMGWLMQRYSGGAG